jgi:hypothetical protein
MVKQTEQVEKKRLPWFIKRQKLKPKAPKECDFEITISLRKLMRGT